MGVVLVNVMSTETSLFGFVMLYFVGSDWLVVFNVNVERLW